MRGPRASCWERDGGTDGDRTVRPPGVPGWAEVSTEAGMAGNLKRVSEAAVRRRVIAQEAAAGSGASGKSKRVHSHRTSTMGGRLPRQRDVIGPLLPFDPCAQSREAHPSTHHLSLRPS